MTDALRLAGLLSLFLGGAMLFHAFKEQGNVSQFAVQFILSPVLIYFGLKLLL